MSVCVRSSQFSKRGSSWLLPRTLLLAKQSVKLKIPGKTSPVKPSWNAFPSSRALTPPPPTPPRCFRGIWLHGEGARHACAGQVSPLHPTDVPRVLSPSPSWVLGPTGRGIGCPQHPWAAVNWGGKREPESFPASQVPVFGAAVIHTALWVFAIASTPLPEQTRRSPWETCAALRPCSQHLEGIGRNTHTQRALLPQQPFNAFLSHADHFSIAVFWFTYWRFTRRRRGCSGGEGGSLTGRVPGGSVASAALIKCVSFPLSKHMPRNRGLFVLRLLLV